MRIPLTACSSIAGWSDALAMSETFKLNRRLLRLDKIEGPCFIQRHEMSRRQNPR